jgi:8-oxo-dGTP pyrophosphatase MutT (NUDIX family)
MSDGAPSDGAPFGAVNGRGDFFDRARARLSLDVPAALTDLSAPAVRGDLDLDPQAWKTAGVAAVRPAAVLVAVVDREVPAVILTQRTADLTSHAGQIAFPGGKIEPEDASPAGAALREAEEEIGLGQHLIEPIGYLDLYLTFSGFRILPTLARVDPGYALTLNRFEVAEAFEVPLAFLMQGDNYQRRSRDWNGITRHYYAIPFEDRYIWGVTAGILRNLYERVGRG